MHVRNTIPLLLILALFCPAVPQLAAQTAGTGISGQVLNTAGDPLAGITVRLEGSTRGAATDTRGYFELSRLAPGEHTLVFSAIGYVSEERSVLLAPNERKPLHLTLKEDTLQMQSVMVQGKSEAKLKREEAFSVASISTKSLENTNANIDDILQTNPGIHIRREGGLGSRFNLSLNGLSGRQVRFFMDGLPIENYGSTFGINNIPVNLIERVEVYKGVVPVYLGGDALGGAVNLVTEQSPRHYLDASYAVGSFNTHKLALDGQYVHPSSGFILKTSGFYNYSDNNYTIDVHIPDPETGTYGEEQQVKRFHDAYESRMFNLETGFRGLHFADEIMVGLSLADNRDDVQHGVSMDRVFGRVHTTSNTKLGSLTYRKELNRLQIKAFASFLNSHSGVVDTSAVSYNWLGEYERKNNQNIAESSWEKTLFRYNDEAFQSNVNLRYQFSDQHVAVLNHTRSYINREGHDPISTNPVAFADPNTLNKNVLSGSYKLRLFDDRWSTTIFSKLYFFNSNVIGVDWDGKRSEFNSNTFKPGYGIATTYHPLEGLQAKASYEKTYRFPDGYEVFGDGLLLLSNPQLAPENSNNFNLGLQIERLLGSHRLMAETNYFRRDAKDLIRIQVTGLTSQYINQRSVVSSGIEAGLRYEYERLFFADLNTTYQNILNNSKYENGRISHIYRDRIPNIPYLMSSQSAGLKFDGLIVPHDRLSFTWSGNFVEEYYLKWPSLGADESKYVIPRQYVQHLQLGYSLEDGRYNINVACSNITNAKAYDHFRLQKPGRAFQIKFRYLFN
ncbi:TonB-dependent receptor [Fodinibius sediminis]|uniref:Outer membrane receptor proteins, mostly Fe transport n=1 Tax=Fodinibius sediminis TaxID=1214077 RepID=A0A521BR71_9BACT|nr:TonB-dependent receptor [Fodinibius sediminis]SMO49040.1 Outer membrane receptor proteins, mostly Fe transport [Fodinibius sediminis]